MRRSRSLCFAFLIFLPPAITPAVVRGQSPVGGAAAEATRILNAFLTVPFGQTCEAWRTKHAGATCRRYLRDGENVSLEEYWCEEGIVPGTSEVVHTYVFAPDTLSCRVREFVATDSVSRVLADSAVALLVPHLTKRFGEPLDTRKEGLEGRTRYNPGWLWRTPDFEVLLFSAINWGGMYGVNLIVRNEPLPSLILASEKSEPDEQEVAAEAQFNGRIAKALGGELPGILPLLEPGIDGEWDPAIAAQRLVWIPRLISAADTASAERAALLLAAADELATQYSYVAGDPDSVEARGGRLKMLDVGEVTTDEHYGSVAYGHELLRRTVRKYPETLWGRRGLVQLLGTAWVEGATCEEGPQRRVIAVGEAFASAHPGDPLLSDLWLILARAYETTWSLAANKWFDSPESLLRDTEAQAARRASIAYYEKVLQAPGSPAIARDARTRVTRLRLSLDTGQNTFACLED